MISVDHVSFSYPHTTLLQDVSCHIPQGALMAIFGPNGVGKTTFLKILCGLLQPSAGQVTLHSTDIGFLTQRQTLDDAFPITVKEVVAMGLYRKNGWHRSPTPEQRTTIHKALSYLNLLTIQDKMIGAVSGGQFQRVLFARLIAQNPEIIFLDEPFSGVDCYTLKYLIQQIQNWQAMGKTQLVVLHDLALIKSYFPDCILIGASFLKCFKTEEVVSDPKLFSQIFFCGEHLAQHDIF